MVLRTAGIAALALAVRVIAAWAIPFAVGPGDPNFAPDEFQHFRVVSDLSEGRAPVWPASPTVYSVFPPVQYVAQAATLRLGRSLPDVRRVQGADDAGRGIFWARLGSVLLGAGSAILMARMVAAAAGEAAGAWAGVAAAIFPQFVFATSYCNADALTIFAGLLLLHALLRWLKAADRPAAAYLGLATGLVLVAKVNGWFLMVPVAVCAFRRQPRLLPIAGATAAAVALPCLAWNAARTGGDALGTRLYARFMAEVWKPQTLLQIDHGLIKFISIETSSAVGVFGNMSLSLPIVLRLAIVAFIAAGVLLWVRGATRRHARFLAAVVALNLGFELAKSLFVDFQPQGRYLLVSVLLLVSAALVGLRSRGRAWSGAFAAVLVASTAVMEWQLIAKGR